MAIDKAGQNSLALDINHLSAGGNSDFAPTTDCLELACLDNDNGILNRWPAGAIDQFSTLHHERFLCHIFFSSSPQCKVFDEPLKCQFFYNLMPGIVKLKGATTSVSSWFSLRCWAECRARARQTIQNRKTGELSRGSS
jgi:hypothetical protein